MTLPSWNKELSFVLYISGIEIGRKFSISIFYDCPIDRSRHHVDSFQLSRGLVFA